MSEGIMLLTLVEVGISCRFEHFLP